MRKELDRKVVDGNDAVIECLDLVRAKAKETNASYIMIVTATDPGHFEVMCAGVYGMEMAINTGLDVAKQRILHQMQNVALPQNTTKTTTADHVIFNLAKTPTNFDFMNWMVVQEMTRIREGAPAPLKVQWFEGVDGQSGLNTPARRKNFEGIIRPALALIGAVEEPLGDGRLVENCSLRSAVEACRNGERVPKFKVPAEVQAMADRSILDQFGKPPVTITLREAEHYPHRNSNLPEWLKFAEYLEGQGEKVLFIRDTAKAAQVLEAPFPTSPSASCDLLVRSAIYSSARANLFVANGPATIAIFMDAPWLIFNAIDNKGTYKPNTDEGWLVCTGIESVKQEQFPWCRRDQRIIWENDTFEVMRAAWEDYIACSSEEKKLASASR